MNEKQLQHQQYEIQKWITFLLFGIVYITVYYGRFAILYHIEAISQSLGVTKDIEIYVYSAVILSYAIGSFFMGRWADMLQRPIGLILLGTGISFLTNISLVFVHLWKHPIFLSIINGLFQSMIWVNGILLITMWWKSSQRPISGGIINFFSGLAHIPAFFLPGMVMLTSNDREVIQKNYSFILIICVILFFFFLIAANNPQKAGFAHYHEDNEIISGREKYLYEQIKLKKKSPWKFFFKGKKMWCWCGIAFLSSICRYGLLEWIPRYYSAIDFIPILDERFSNIILPLGMAFGTLIMTYIAGTKFSRNKGIVVILCAALCGTLIVIFPMMPSIRIVLIGVFFTGFFLFGINGIIWIYTMDRGGRIYSATIAGVLNGFAYLGTFLQEFLFRNILHQWQSWFSIFVLMELICFAIVGLAIIASEKDTNIEIEME